MVHFGHIYLVYLTDMSINLLHLADNQIGSTATWNFSSEVPRLLYSYKWIDVVYAATMLMFSGLQNCLH